MSPGEILDITRAGLTLLFTVSMPLLVAALLTGVLIGLIQALTQVQEMTLTFVPKLLVMGVVLLLSLPMMGAAMSEFTEELRVHIAGA